MFGVGSKIESFPVAVACENMRGFVEGLGLLPGGKREFRRHDSEQQRDSDHESNAPGGKWILIGHVPKKDGRKKS